MDYEQGVSTDSDMWLPSNIRTLGQTDDNEDNMELTREFYEETSNFQKYSYTLYSLIILTLGNDIAPVNVG